MSLCGRSERRRGADMLCHVPKDADARKVMWCVTTSNTYVGEEGSAVFSFVAALSVPLDSSVLIPVSSIYWLSYIYRAVAKKLELLLFWDAR